MQRIERYGVIALVFLLVTIAAVSFWGDGAGAKKKKSERTAEVARSAAASPAQNPSRQQRTRPRRTDPSPEERALVPLGPRDRTPQGTAGQPAGQRSAGRSGDRPAQRNARNAAEQPRSLTELSAGQARTAADDVPRIQGRREPPLVVDEQRRRSESQPATPRTQPAARPASAPPSGTVRYLVKPGQTLSGIALATLGNADRWRDIQTLNGGLRPEDLQADTTILLPEGAVFAAGEGARSAPAARRAPAAAERGAETWTYEIRSGDTLSAIAQRELGSWRRYTEILQLNPGQNPDVVIAGRKLVMPGNGRRSVVAQASPSPDSARRDERHVVR